MKWLPVAVRSLKNQFPVGKFVVEIFEGSIQLAGGLGVGKRPTPPSESPFLGVGLVANLQHESGNNCFPSAPARAVA